MTMTNTGLRLSLFCGTAAILMFGAHASAAAAEAATTAAKPEEVIVTARRTDEKLQEVPIAVTAVSARQLETIKPRTIEDLGGIAPNVEIGRVGAGAGSSAIYIRGLGYSDIEKGQNPAVGLLIDDVVIGTNTAQLIDAFDISQVEIDRGPQGIFYGKNTTAGAISIHRSRPTHAWGLNLDVGYGDYNQNTEKVIFNAPIADTAGLKLGFSHRSRQGFLNNLYTGNTHYGRDELSTGTVAFDWNLTPQIHLLATGDFTHQDGEGTPVALGDPLSAKVYSFLTAVIPGLAYNQYGSPYIPGVTVPLGPWQVANDFPDRNLLTQQRYSANLTYNSPIGQFVSITAYINQNDDAEQDFDGSCGVSTLGGQTCSVLPNPILGFLHTSRPQKYEQFSEEARFTHDFGSRAKAMVGVYYFHHKIEALQLTRTRVPGVPVDDPITNQISGERNHSLSFFGNLDFSVTDRLRLSGGLRYIDESTTFHNAFNIIFPVGTTTPNGAFTASKSWRKVITRFSADYKLTDQNLLYASRSQGFRSGGFSPRGTLSESRPGNTNYSPGANYSAFDPETDISYEIGSKNTFLNGQVVFNIDAFYNLDSNHQASQVVSTPGDGPGTNTYIVNIPKVEIKGAEFELTVRPEPLRGFTLMATGGIQDAKITNGKIPGVEAPIGPGGTAGAPGTTSDLTGTPLERVGKYNFRIGGDYAVDVGPGKFDLNVGYKWTDKYLFTTLAGLGDYQPSFGLLDASASYSWKQYKLTVSAKNIANQIYRSNSLPVVFFQGWGDPRTVFAELQAKF